MLGSFERRALGGILDVAGVAGFLGDTEQLYDTTSTFVQAVDLTNGRPKLFELEMGICEQCKRLEPVMEQAAQEFGGRVGT